MQRYSFRLFPGQEPGILSTGTVQGEMLPHMRVRICSQKTTMNNENREFKLNPYLSQLSKQLAQFRLLSREYSSFCYYSSLRRFRKLVISAGFYTQLVTRFIFGLFLEMAIED